MPLFTTKNRSFFVNVKELFTVSAGIFIFLLLGYACKYIFTLSVTRLYGAYVMGLFSLGFTAIQISVTVGRLGIDYTFVRFMSGYKTKNELGKIKHLYLRGNSLVFLFSLCIAVIVYCLSPWLAEVVFENLDLEKIFKIAAFGIIPLALLYLNNESLRGVNCLMKYAFFSHSSTFLLGCILLLGSQFLFHNTLLPIIILVSAIWLTLIFANFSFMKEISFPKIICQPSLPLTVLLKNSLPLMLASSVQLILGWIDIIMIGMMKSTTDVGVYHVVIKVASLSIIPAFALNGIATRKFAEFYEAGNLPGLLQFIKHTSRLFFYITFPFVFLIGICAPYVMSMFGSEFYVGTLALRILLVGQFMPAFSGSIGNILKMTNNQVPLQYIMIMSLILNVALNYFLIPLYGINGAATASTLSLISWNIAGGIFFYRRYGINTFHLPGFSKN